MLTKLIIRNFKRFDDVAIELGNPVVFIGPNNSGKTSALQALSLWQVGLLSWIERRGGKSAPAKRPGVTINRRDVLALPVPHTNLLWRNLAVRSSSRGEEGPNVLFEIIVEGLTDGKSWAFGFEFDYANPESFFCRPAKVDHGKGARRMELPEEAKRVQMAFLPPMSGLTSKEDRLEPGSIRVRIGEGRTAEVLRNLCHLIQVNSDEKWRLFTSQIKTLFGAELERPQYVEARGEINMTYREKGISLDLSSSGRGLQQTLLLLAYMYGNPNAVLLLDEPDAHLEILRQRQIYQVLCDVAKENGNQVVAASHSEVLLNEAAGRDVVIAFVGKPHRINDQGSQVGKSLRAIGFEHYYLAELTGWALYLEGSTDLAILRSLASRLGKKDVLAVLERPLVHYVGNDVGKIRDHFYGVREAVPGMRGFAVLDRRDQALPDNLGADAHVWSKYEIESYLCFPETLLGYASHSAQKDSLGPLFSPQESARRTESMRAAIAEVERALRTLQKGSPWDGNVKVSDDFLIPVFKRYFDTLGLPNVMAKKNFHELVEHVPQEKLDAEIGRVLDRILRVATEARTLKSN
jgi:hypothetical protein